MNHESFCTSVTSHNIIRKEQVIKAAEEAAKKSGGMFSIFSSK
jgi:hypothetical protein